VFCFVRVLCVFNKFNDHGGRRGNTMQALNRWWHPVASNEAPDVLHWVMCPAFYHHICMTIEIASNSIAFFIVVDTFFAPNLI
jgi:hypothetical protein